jgi:MFS family permease
MNTTTPIESRARWLALGVLCLGNLMIVLDTTIVNVALPSIRQDLGFSESSLAWVVNAYLLTFGGFLLLGGRLGDLLGHRRMFVTGIACFTGASVACGLAGSPATLVVARAVQGLGGAVVSAVALSLVMTLFTEPAERAKAMGFIAAVLVLATRILPAADETRPRGSIDLAGAVTVTVALMLAVYGIVGGNAAGWTSGRTLGVLVASVAMLAVFLRIESTVEAPLVPLGLFRRRNLAVSNIVGVLWAAAMFAWFFLSALYLQLVLGYSPLQVGLSFLPANLVMGAFSLGLSAKLVMRFGIRAPLGMGLLLAAAGLVLFARAPVGGDYLTDVLPAMLLLGVGAGMAFNPVLLAAMSDAEPADAGLASGVVNTSFMMGGALGLAVLASVAAARTADLTRSGAAQVVALTGGYHAAFVVGALAAAAAGVIGWTALRIAGPAVSEQADGDDEVRIPQAA